MRKILITCCLCALYVGFYEVCFARIDPADTTLASVRLLSTRWIASPQSIEDEVAIVVKRKAAELGLDDVLIALDASDPETLFSPDDAESSVSPNEINLLGFSDAIVLRVTRFSQQAAYEKSDDAYFPMVHVQDDSVRMAIKKNIRTNITVLLRIFDASNGRFLTSFEVSASHTSGKAIKSKARALNILGEKVKRELKLFYWLSSEISFFEQGKIMVPLGAIHGLRKGMLFELIASDADGTSSSPAGSAGYASVETVTEDNSTLQTLRQFTSLTTEARIVEYPHKIWALQLNVLPPSTEGYQHLSFQINLRPLQQLDWGLRFQILQIHDSRDDRDLGFGFGGFGMWRFLRTPALRMGVGLGVDLDIPFRKDETSQIVNSALLSAHLALTAEFYLKPNLDFILHTGYRFALRTDEWTYSEDEESFPATWYSDPPELDHTGFIFSAGVRYYLF